MSDPRHGEGRPRQDGPESPREKLVDSVAPRAVVCVIDGQPARVVRDAAAGEGGYTFDDLQAAYVAGIETGLLSSVEQRANARAQELLHDRSLTMLGMARAHAERVGQAWAALMEAAAAEPWGESP